MGKGPRGREGKERREVALWLLGGWTPLLGRRQIQLEMREGTQQRLKRDRRCACGDSREPAASWQFGNEQLHCSTPMSTRVNFHRLKLLKSYHIVLKPAVEISFFFAKWNYRKITVVVGIKYSIRDSVSDANYCSTCVTSMRELSAQMKWNWNKTVSKLFRNCFVSAQTNAQASWPDRFEFHA